MLHAHLFLSTSMPLRNQSDLSVCMVLHFSVADEDEKCSYLL